MSQPLRFAIFGTGFWSRFQLAAWRELPGAECVALYNRTRGKAEALGREFGIAAIYDDPQRLLEQERLDFVDIITDVDSHPRLVELVAAAGRPVICQKPMAPTLAAAERMVAACDAAGAPFFVHENWRWQTPLRRLKEALSRPDVGTVFRARVDFVSGFPVFANQPFLRDLEHFILTDIGSHILDTARFLFGEAESLYCQTHHVHRDLKGEPVRGEDVATVMMRVRPGPGRSPVTVVCNMGYAENALERDRFPETSVFAETDRGSVELGPDYWLRVTTEDGTQSRRVPPPRYAWADPAYDVVQSSIVACNADLLRALRGEGAAETTGRDNLNTVRLVFAAYDSAARDAVISLPMTAGGS